MPQTLDQWLSDIETDEPKVASLDEWLQELSLEKRPPDADEERRRRHASIAAGSQLTPEEFESIRASMPERGFIEQTIGETIPGQAARAVNRFLVEREGIPYVETPAKELGPVGRLARQIGSFLIDASMLSPGARVAGTAAAGPKVIGETLKRSILRHSVEGATLLGGMTAFHSPLTQYRETGEVDIGEAALDVTRSAGLGAALGPISEIPGAVARPLGKIGEFGARTTAEIAGLGTLAPAFEGRLPTTEDYIDSAGLILGTKGAGLLARLAGRLRNRGPDDDPMKIAEEILGKEKAEEIKAATIARTKSEGLTTEPATVAEQRGIVVDVEAQKALIADYESRKAAGQKDPMPNADAFEAAGFGRPTRKERQVIIDQIKEQANATRLREDAGQVQKTGTLREGRETPGRQDIQRQAEARAEARDAETQGITREPPSQAEPAQPAVPVPPVVEAPVAKTVPPFKPLRWVEFLKSKGIPEDLKIKDKRYAKLKKEFDALREAQEEALGVLPSMPGLRDAVGRGLRPKNADYLPDDPAVAERLMNASLPVSRSWLKTLAKPARAFLNKITRAREHLPETGDFASINDILRRFESQHELVRQYTIDALNRMTHPLANDRDLALFTIKLVAEDQMAGLSAKGGPQKLGYGYTPESLRDHIRKLDAAIAENPRVQAALEQRKEVVDSIVRELVNHGAPKEWLDNTEYYWHREVAAYRMAETEGGRGTGRTLKKTKKSYEHKRTKAEDPGVSEQKWYDPSTNWAQAETSWIRQAFDTIQTANIAGEMAKVADIKPQLVAEAKKSGTDWKTLIPETHVVYVPPPGHTFYKTFTVGAKIAEAIEAGTYKELKLRPSDVRRAVALGRPQFEWVVPKELAAQLDLIAKPKLEGPLGIVANRVQQAWKQWETMLSPKRSLPYGVSNISGDVGPVIAVIPSALRPANLKTAWRELWHYRVSGKGMSEAIHRQLENGVIGSGKTATEVEAMGANPEFARLLPRNFSWLKMPSRTVGEYANFMRSIHMFREDWLRSAVEREYLHYMRSGRRIPYGGSKRNIIKRIRRELGDEKAAAKLALDLVGNYADVRVGTKWLSRYAMPFARWSDINLRREPRIVSNLFREAYEQGGLKEMPKASAKVAALAAIKTSVLAARSVALFSSLFTLSWLWNHFIYGELEEGLTEDDQSRPHLIIGVRSDGSPVLVRNFGALGAFLDFTGLTRLTMLIPLYLDKQISAKRLVEDVGWEVVNNTAQMIGPYYKLPVEVGTGASLFPDIRHPRPRTTGELISSIPGMTEEYKEIRGRLLDTGERARPGRFMSPFPTGTDNRRGALIDSYTWRRRFLESIGRPDEGVYPRSAFRTIRESGYNNDYEAFKEARQVYLHGDRARGYEDFMRHLGTLDPIALKLNDENEEKFVNEYLRPDQVVRLREARDYASEIYYRLWYWYRQAVYEQDTEKQQEQYERDVRAHIGRLKKTVRSRPRRIAGESAEDFARRSDAQLRRRERAAQTLELLTSP